MGNTFAFETSYCYYIQIMLSIISSDLSRATPSFKDYLQHQSIYAFPTDPNTEAAAATGAIVGAHTATVDPKSLQPRHSQIIQQYSSSTDEGCDTDHGDMDDAPAIPSAAASASATCQASSSLPTPSIQRLNSYASSSSSSGVVTNFHSKSLSQNLSCESSRSNFSTLESLDLNLSDCSDLAGSLPSCASSSAQTTIDTTVMDGECVIFDYVRCGWS